MRREFPDAPIPAAAAVVVQGGRVLLIKRGFPPNEGKWSIPGGVIEVGEEARDAAVREVLEETGLRIRIRDIVDVVDNIIRDEERVKYHFVNCDFLADWVSGEVHTTEETPDFAWIEEKDMEKYDMTRGASRVVRMVFEGMRGERKKDMV